MPAPTLKGIEPAARKMRRRCLKPEPGAQGGREKLSSVPEAVKTARIGARKTHNMLDLKGRST